MHQMFHVRPLSLRCATRSHVGNSTLCATMEESPNLGRIAMNVVFVSPQFPDTYWNWCDRLRKNGATVLGILLMEVRQD